MQDTQHTIAFLGAGNMAISLLRGLTETGVDAGRLRAADPAPEQRARADALGIATFAENQAALAGADVVVLAVKPQIAGAVLESLSLSDDQMLVSIAAGIGLKSLARWTSATQPIVRCMPNTPALVGAGMTALYANDRCSAPQRQAAERLLDACGSVLWVEEEAALDAVTAVSGSGPAYFFALMEAMVQAGQSLGLSEAQARQLTLQTAYGAALMTREEGADPATLRRNVTSPGGTTAAALETLDAHDFTQLIETALAAAADRSRALAEEFGEE